MKKELTSAEAAALIYGSPGTKVLNRCGESVHVDNGGRLLRGNLLTGAALMIEDGPFTLPADPDELPEDVLTALDKERYINSGVHIAFEALWKHIKPEAKR